MPLSNNSVGNISYNIAKGSFDPHMRLTNMAMAYFQSMENRPAKSLFPTLPVQQSTNFYYIFGKDDLLRDDVKRKPQMGKVAPSTISSQVDTYQCLVDQIIMGIDQIMQVDYQRAGIPAFMSKENALTRSITLKMAIHADRIFADKFFKTGVWDTEWTGVAAASADDATKKFTKFSDSNSSPIEFFQRRIMDVQRKTGRKPNKLGLGMDTYFYLINHPSVLERIVGSASSANPALANERTLASLIGVKEVTVFDPVANNASLGKEEDIDFICDSKGALLVYAPDTPSVEEPSAGYTFTWDMLGDGQVLPIIKHVNQDATHTEELEGLMATDMRITANDLGIFFADCV